MSEREWRPISEAPKDGTWVLVICAGCHPDTGQPFIPAVAAYQKGAWTEDDDGPSDDDHLWRPTHWQELPAGPSA